MAKKKLALSDMKKWWDGASPEERKEMLVQARILDPVFYFDPERAGCDAEGLEKSVEERRVINLQFIEEQLKTGLAFPEILFDFTESLFWVREHCEYAGTPGDFTVWIDGKKVKSIAAGK